MEPAMAGRTPPPGVTHLPEGWHVVRRSGPLGFVTHVVLERPDGRRVEWTSRRHRKALGLRPARRHHIGTRIGLGSGASSPTSRWMGALFGIGAVCFALGSLPLYFTRVDPSVTAWTFFIGSIPFTSAAYLQYRETLAAPEGVLVDSARPGPLRTLVGWKPRRIAWWACMIQLIGTVCFNVSTFAATRSDLSVDREVHVIWTPDLAGSICFLVASWLAYTEVNPGLLPRSDRSVGWRICVLNLAGSVAFGAAAVGSRYVPSTGEPANIALVNLGTFTGAICFLLGAVLLPVESAHDATVDEAT
ncbi:hypothetical protein [Solicola gregarius]|uniref:YrhK domain-containing protein n=1 Tax=Solicola gregarius TaxID=2908642 RepID=A0AA46TET0_9ACTN|nr:hypothetical protein [Solicola gregarius]UYM03544.1 hypothetical protein L0C25_13355 [Solicola gregarius]